MESVGVGSAKSGLMIRRASALCTACDPRGPGVDHGWRVARASPSRVRRRRIQLCPRVDFGRSQDDDAGVVVWLERRRSHLGLRRHPRGPDRGGPDGPRPRSSRRRRRLGSGCPHRHLRRHRHRSGPGRRPGRHLCSLCPFVSSSPCRGCRSLGAELWLRAFGPAVRSGCVAVTISPRSSLCDGRISPRSIRSLIRDGRSSGPVLLGRSRAATSLPCDGGGAP